MLLYVFTPEIMQVLFIYLFIYIFVYIFIDISNLFFRRPKCDKNVQHCANNDSAAVLKLEEWKKNLCSNCKLHNSRKEKLYYNCKAEKKDSLGYG